MSSHCEPTAACNTITTIAASTSHYTCDELVKLYSDLKTANTVLSSENSALGKLLVAAICLAAVTSILSCVFAYCEHRVVNRLKKTARDDERFHELRGFSNDNNNHNNTSEGLERRSESQSRQCRPDDIGVAL
jgi:hypothetical protein